MCHGVSKSGSPMPRLMTSFIVLTMSKKSRMPERGMSRTHVRRGDQRGPEQEP
jgi:hypothetical protein